MKGQPPPEAPGNAPEGLHCFQQRKVSFDQEAAEEALALAKAFDSFGGPRAEGGWRGGLWGPCVEGVCGAQGWRICGVSGSSCQGVGCSKVAVLLWGLGTAWAFPHNSIIFFYPQG